jgi:hypothetical protein
MSQGDFAIRVDCREGHRGEPVPCIFFLGPRQVRVEEVVDRWHGDDHRYYKVRGDDGDLYILRHEPGREHWELTVFTSAAAMLPS